MNEDLPIHRFRFPRSLTSLASSLLGPLLGYPPSAAAAATAQPPPQRRQGADRPPADFDHGNMSDREQALMAGQLEAILRQQLDGGGLRGRAPRQQPPQPEDIARVMEFSGRDRQSAIEALQNNGGDVEAALNELLH